jgi:endonuclease-3
VNSKSTDIANIVEKLESIYGKSVYHQRFQPLDELVCCILSQHTSDLNSFAAFDRLKAAFPDWESALTAKPAEIIKVIQSAGLANQKTKYIQSCLKTIKEKVGSLNIDFLASMPLLEARNWLTDLPGVGPKTASIVLCFSFGMEAIPVDTHIYRVSKRIGIIPENMDANKAHDLLLKVVPKKLAFAYHMALIQHGRNICKAQRPKCSDCMISNQCKWYLLNKSKA